MTKDETFHTNKVKASGLSNSDCLTIVGSEDLNTERNFRADSTTNLS